MKKGLIISGLILLLVLLAIEILLPGYYEEKVEMVFRRQVDRVEFLEVNVSTHPALLLLTGRVQNGFIQARGVEFKGLRIESVESAYKDLIIANTPEGTKAVAGRNTFFQATFSEEDLNNYLKAIFTQFEDLNLELTPDLVSLDFKINLFGNVIELKLTGDFVVPDNHTVRFVPHSLEIGQYKITKLVLLKILKDIEFELEMKQYPLPLDLKEIRIEEGRLRVLGGSSQ
ncbi:hypothetical protein BBF96_01555 [Anoxybacter fermentans]|uniref:DUF2993 domain-containing protein n=1 Tax=Anoxybacter fermentans TaxID=1323375 RepID=A0A3S9SV90_9FIRM|nr:DUF2993 domain-containing protein [Anoxybacter fermentans]AZR72195.1 hypothetical protein BBF96_01555 [Anoxybacter fermentans]